MFIRTPYNYNRYQASCETGLACLDESLTQQDQAEDVNDLVRKFGITGKMPLNIRTPQYGDFTGIGTYQECLQAVRDAENEFMKLPALIRERFKHNPQNFLDFVEDPKNASEGEKLGIWKLKKQASGSEPASPASDSVATKVEPKKANES